MSLEQGPTIVQDVSPPTDSLPSLRRSTRATKPPSYLEDYKCSTIISNESTQSNPNNKLGSSSAILGIKYPISDYLDSSSLSPSYATFCSLITSIPDVTPHNFDTNLILIHKLNRRATIKWV